MTVPTPEEWDGKCPTCPAEPLRAKRSKCPVCGEWMTWVPDHPGHKLPILGKWRKSVVDSKSIAFLAHLRTHLPKQIVDTFYEKVDP